MPADDLLSRGYVSLSCHLPVPLFNPTFILDAPNDPARFVDAVLAERGEGPMLVYARDDAHPAVADACAARGLVENNRQPLMVRRRLEITRDAVADAKEERRARARSAQR